MSVTHPWQAIKHLFHHMWAHASAGPACGTSFTEFGVWSGGEYVCRYAAWSISPAWWRLMESSPARRGQRLHVVECLLQVQSDWQQTGGDSTAQMTQPGSTALMCSR